jgi:hypothetical protein
MSTLLCRRRGQARPDDPGLLALRCTSISAERLLRPPQPHPSLGFEPSAKETETEEEEEEASPYEYVA